MQFEHTEKVKALIARLEAFFTDHIYPNEQAVSQLVHSREGKERWEALPVVEQLKPKARSAGLWNMFLPHSGSGAGLTNLEYAPLCEIMGRVVWSSEVFNCSAPDTGNMEILDRFASPANKERWLKPLLNGEIRSAFCMTEPAVASSDATNIETSIRRDGSATSPRARARCASLTGRMRCTGIGSGRWSCRGTEHDGFIVV
jgi:acyl-CoA dehydrogenase